MKEKLKNWKSKTDFCIDFRISDMSNTYYLSAGYDEKKDIYFLPSLERTEGENQIFYYDNSSYLIGPLLITLEKYIKGKEKTPDFNSVEEDIPISDFGIVYDILMQGIKLGFFDYDEYGNKIEANEEKGKETL